jgi:hypothetical protein
MMQADAGPFFVSRLLVIFAEYILQQVIPGDPVSGYTAKS